MYTTLISVDQLQRLQAGNAPRMVFDCSFDLMRPDDGEEQYRSVHLPGAVYAHFDRALSAHDLVDGDGQRRRHPDAVCGGRHPMPRRERIVEWLSAIGFRNDMQAVVYDRSGATYCGRLWWMLKWVGHEAVAVLDGGMQAWQAAGGQLASGLEPTCPRSQFALGSELRSLVTVEQVLDRLGRPDQTIIDARGAPRYRGESEPVDPVAGHIPGALNRPFTDNVGPDGKFKSPSILRQEFERLLDGRHPTSVVHQCGSGGSALNNALAMECAGFPPAPLYAGSWSEWCSDPGRPIATSQGAREFRSSTAAGAPGIGLPGSL